jgi:hypothetical protein
VNILSPHQHPPWSGIKLNDGSWEFCIPLIYIKKFVWKYPNANIDLEYNPLFVPQHDVKYFESFSTAHRMNGVWLEERAKRIDGIPRGFYKCLTNIQKLISGVLILY